MSKQEVVAGRVDWRVGLLVLIPFVVAVGLLMTPVPKGAHTAREVAAHFQTLSILRDGFGSYFYYTPAESKASVHLYNLFSVPMLAAGWVEGGRLVNLFGMTLSAVVVARLATELVDRRSAALLAVGSFWMHPWVLAATTAYNPDALSILFTSLSVLGTLRWLDSRETVLFVGVCLATLCGLANHLWEVTIALPVVVLLLWEREYCRTGIYLTVTGLAFAIISRITELQATARSSMGSHLSYSVFTNPTALVSTEFWLGHLSSPHPVNVDVTVTLLLSLVAVVVTAWWAYRSWRRDVTLVSCWLAAGLSIPFLLPRGFLAHLYYTWGLYVPLTLCFVLVVHELAGRWSIEQRQFHRLVSAVSVSAVALGVLYLLVFEYALLTGVVASPALTQATTPTVTQQTGLEQAEIIAAGEQIGQLTDDPGEVVYVGSNWSIKPVEGTVAYGPSLGVSQSLVYSDLLVKSRHINGGDGPRIAPNATDCTVAVYRNATDITVRQC